MLRPTRSGETFRPTRAKGQSFLRDRPTSDRIVKAIGAVAGDAILEIGAGTGELTLPLAKSGATPLIAIEPEAFLAQKLRDSLTKVQQGDVEVIESDFLALDLSQLLSERGIEKARIVGNLPYSAATAILLELLLQRARLVDLTLMFQLEVAERLVARRGTKAYGFLAVVTQQATRPRILFRIPPRVFRPRPKVYSALVRLDVRDEDELKIADPEVFRLLVKGLLAHRRKTISNNIKRLQPSVLTETGIRHGLAQLDIDESQRAEALGVEEFVALSRFCTSTQ